MVMKEKSVSIIVSEWENGAGKLGSGLGPKTLIQSYENEGHTLNCETLHSDFVSGKIATQNSTQTNIASHRSNLKNGQALLEHQTAFAKKVAHQLSMQHRCLLLTADHSNGIGGVSGLCLTTDAKNVGVIWIDAHYDLHSPYTTPSGNSHGMAVNALIDDNNPEHAEQAVTPEEANLWESIKEIKGLGNAVPAANLVFLGVRDFEEPEEALVEKHNICSIQPNEINTQGIDACIEKALAHLAHCTHLYVSFDVDSIDPSISTATGTPVDGGLTLDQSKAVIQQLMADDRTRCLEITEFNPTLPQPNEMLAAVKEILSVSGLV